MLTNKTKKHYERIDQEIESLISIRFSEYLMSNSKWVRLIDRLVQSVDKVKKIEFKKVQNNAIGELYLQEDTTFGFDYWQNGFEGHNSLGGWLTFREIEYLNFPRVLNSENQLQQDLNEIENLINGVGHFFLDVDEDRIKLICYK